MKNLKYILLGCAIVLGFTSCKKWLDVNTDPDNPNSSSVLVQNRLPWIQHFFQYTSGVANFRTACQAGVYYSNAGTANALSTTWTSNTGNTTPYQQWFVATASNLNDMYNTAKLKGAYHYMAAADVFHAMGFMMMEDIYGEMPYTQALAGIASPTYDDGKTIYNGCIAKLNEAISLFSKTQDVGAPALSAGDLWNGGDVSKWVKLCYGLKARYMMRLTKKSDLFNADSVIYFLSKGPQSNADNTIGPGLNNSTATDYLIGDPIVTNGNWDYAAQGSNQRISQFYYNLLTNMRGSNVIDPRMSKIVPAAMTGVKLDANGRVISNNWNRSVGVDVMGAATRLKAGGAGSIVTTVSYAGMSPVNITYAIPDPTAFTNFVNAQIAAGRPYTVNGTNVTVTYQPGSLYINSNNYILAGDTSYVNLRSCSLQYGTPGVNSITDLNWYPSTAAANAGVIGSTGSFQVRPVSDQEILTYHEMCFIKAEVYMRKGDPANAYTAYRAGIQAHLDMMQAKLIQWQAGGYNNPDMWPMNATDITNYMASASVCQNAGNLSMSDIMLQKYVAMGCSIENWVDMRRFNYSAGNIGTFGIVYPGFARSPLFLGASFYPGAAPTDPRYWPRRWPVPTTLELNYNSINVLAINPHESEPVIWSMPVWWDCATDAEYYGYLR